MKKFAITLAFLMMQAAALFAQVPRVSVDIPPVQSLVAQVMEGVGAPDLIMRPGASPHGYAMRPSEAAQLQRADVVFYVAAELTPWFRRATDTLAGSAEVVELLKADGAIRHGFRETAVFTHADENDDGGHDDHDHDDHAPGMIDPHGWLDPENAKLWLARIAETLAAQDPENAALYRANATAGQIEIDAAVAQAKALLDPVRDRNFIVFHDAYQYFERRFRLSVSGAISLSDATAPGPRRIAELQQIVAEHDVVCVFSEPQLNPGMVDTVVGDAGVRVARLDPLGSMLDPGPKLYPALIRTMARDIATCLGGS